MADYLKRIANLTTKIDNELTFSEEDYKEFLSIARDFGEVELRKCEDGDIMDVDVFACFKTDSETGYVLIAHCINGTTEYEYPKKCYVNTTTRVIHNTSFIDEEGNNILSKETYE